MLGGVETAVNQKLRYWLHITKYFGTVQHDLGIGTTGWLMIVFIRWLLCVSKKAACEQTNDSKSKNSEARVE